MNLINKLTFLLHLSRSQGIARRYLVTNGFDGALTMLGLVVGFYVSAETDLAVVIGVCLAAAIALGMSGISSAYVSESVERKKELAELEEAMVTELKESAHGKAARLIPFMIALVNGLAPMVFSLLIITPLWLAQHGLPLPLDPFKASILVSFIIIFLLGVFLGRVSGVFWLWAGLRTVLVAIVTGVLIFLVS